MALGGQNRPTKCSNLAHRTLFLKKSKGCVYKRLNNTKFQGFFFTIYNRNDYLCSGG